MKVLRRCTLEPTIKTLKIAFMIVLLYFYFFYFFKQDQLLRSPTSTYPSFGSILRLSTLHR